MKHFLLTIVLSVFSIYSIMAQNNVGIGTTSPTHQLHTTQGVRHEILSGKGLRPLYADSAGILTTQQLLILNGDSAIANQVINDVSCTPALSSINISGWPTNINPKNLLLTLNIAHNSLAEIAVFLISPTNDTLLVWASDAFGDSLINAQFSDIGIDNASLDPSPLTGHYKPNGSIGSLCGTFTNVSTFGALNGNSGSMNPNGLWMLYVYDFSNSFSNTNGLLQSWKLEYDSLTIISALNNQNYIPKYTIYGFDNSNIYQNGNNIGINNTNAAYALQVNGDGVFASTSSAVIGQNNLSSNYSSPSLRYSEGRIATYNSIPFFNGKDVGVWGNAYNDIGGIPDGYGGVFSSSDSTGIQDKLVVLGGTGTNPAGAFIGGNVGIGLLNPTHKLTVADVNPNDNQQVTVRGYSNTPLNWKGGGAFGYSAASVILGEVSGVAQIGGHNANLSAWADLAINSGGGNVGIGTTTPTYKLDVNGDSRTNNLLVNNTVTATTASLTNANITTAISFPNGAGIGKVLTSDALGNASWQVATGGITGSGTASGSTSYIPRFASNTSLTNSIIQQNLTNNGLGINVAPLTPYLLYVYRQQLTVNGDGQTTLYGYRTRDSQNDGTGYSQAFSNDATRGYNFWGDVYTFGVSGFNYNDYTRCGGTLGAEQSGAYWGSLGYKNSASVTYGVYGSTAYASGTGLLPTESVNGIGGGFFGAIGSVSKGSIVGQMNEGELFATYNKGDVYTSGKTVELITTADEKVIPSYAVTSAELTVYNKGKITLVNGEATVTFNENYSNILGEAPIVTASPMGNCNGVYVTNVTKNGFTIKELNNGNNSVEISWIAVGNRIDAQNSEVPNMLTKKEFNSNLSKALYNDGDTKHSGLGMWWNGTEFEFGTMPAKFSLSQEEIQQKIELDKQREAQRKKDLGIE